MNFCQLLLLQVFAHVLADFVFQSEHWARHKNKKGRKSKYLKYHILIVFLLSWLLSFQTLFVMGSLLITGFHFLLDALKKHIEKITITGKNLFGRHIFFIDQFLHLLVISAAVYFYSVYFPLKPWFTIPLNCYHLAILFSYVLCLKPSNILIKEIFQAYAIKLPSGPSVAGYEKAADKREPKELPNAGKLIGNAERIISLTLILIDQFAPVGFLIAAKSIIRYKESDITKTEYVLIGTLLSFGIAIMLGVGLLHVDRGIPN